jgi:hypothetical protein
VSFPNQREASQHARWPVGTKEWKKKKIELIKIAE